jgi:hypothetical protein
MPLCTFEPFLREDGAWIVRVVSTATRAAIPVCETTGAQSAQETADMLAALVAS